jgi:hypothetical protein
MSKNFGLALLVTCTLVCIVGAAHVRAASSSIVISQIQLGSVLSTSEEFIEIYNNSMNDVEITNWCLYYASGPSTHIGSRLACFAPENDDMHVYLPSHTFAFAITNQLSTSFPHLGSDLKFSATLSGNAGHIRLVDDTNTVIDKVGWGTAVSPETTSAIAAPSGRVLQRVADQDMLQDTDDNSLDFMQAQPRTNYGYGAIYEIQDACRNISGVQESPPIDYTIDTEGNCMPPPIDICTNISGIQVVIPLGYAVDVDGLCQPDICTNIAGLQLVVPNQYEISITGDCIQHDRCSNVSGIQLVIPEGYKIEDNDTCLLNLLPIVINELLPNAIGSDNGNEFIEFYNPNNSSVSLTLYRLEIGINGSRSFAFPAGSTIEPHTYIVFSNDDIAFTLLNSTSQVRLVSIDGQSIDESPLYSNPVDGMAWALIDGIWSYTNQPTPNADNRSFVFSTAAIVEVVTDVKPCAPNQYRSPDTNRCRLLIMAGAAVAACKDGQYRSEITNRCRNIAADVTLGLSCNDNQYRNLETGRCKLIATASLDLAPCATNQERNADTNRCRNVSLGIPKAAFAVEPITDTPGSGIEWWAVGGVMVIAIGYAVWEWRQEFAQGFRRFTTFFRIGK